jgi:hypothetical protein
MGVVIVAALAAGACGGREIGPESTDSGTTPTGARFDANYFYCVVEPEVLMGGLSGQPCGDDGSHGCHYSAAISSFALIALSEPVRCSGSGTNAAPIDPSQTGLGSAAASNYEAITFELSPNYMAAPFYRIVTGTNPGHSVVLSPSAEADAAHILKTWATGL